LLDSIQGAGILGELAWGRAGLALELDLDGVEWVPDDQIGDPADGSGCQVLGYVPHLLKDITIKLQQHVFRVL
jgi:hypothetical protein